MKLWGYYAWHTFANTIKKMFRSTVLIVILAVIAFGAIFGLVGGLIGSAVESGESTEISSEVLSEEDSGDELTDEEEEEEMSPEDVAMAKDYVEAGVFLLFLAIVLWGLYSGSKNGTDIFQMADVNFLFTAPMKPQSVLMFRLSFQMAAAIAASLYFIFQIPNLVINAGFGATAIVALFAGYIMLLIFQRLMVVFSYTVFTTHEHLKKYVVPFIWILVALLLAVMAVVFFRVDRDPYRMVQLTFAGRWMRFIPILGWYKGMIMCAINGQLLPFLGYLILLVLGMAVLIFAIWQVKADFYEDALASAGKNAEILDAAKEGRTAVAKKRSKRIQRTGSFGGEGASTFFTKEVYCRRRMAKFGFFTNTMLFYLAVSVLLSVVTVRFMESHSFMLTGCVILAILFFRNFGNPIAQETSMNWLFLVPDSPYKKVFFAMLAGSYSCAIDLLPGLIIGVFLIGEQPLMILLWLLTFVVVDFMLSSVGVLLEAIFPASALDVAKSMIQMILRFFMILVLTVFMVAGYFIGGVVAALVFTTVGSAVIGGIVFIIYPSMLHSGKA